MGWGVESSCVGDSVAPGIDESLIIPGVDPLGWVESSELNGWSGGAISEFHSVVFELAALARRIFSFLVFFAMVRRSGKEQDMISL